MNSSGEARTAGTILIRGARQLLTLQFRGSRGPRRGADWNDLGIIQDGAVLVRDGVIKELGPTRRVENLAEARNALEVNAVGRVVMPGFVDSHTHLPFPPAGGASRDSGSAVRAVLTSSSKLLAAKTRLHLDAMARHGTTTVEAKSGCGGEVAGDIKVLRSLASLKTVPIDVCPTYLMKLPGTSELGTPEGERPEAMRLIGEFLPLLRRRGLALCADLEWEPEAALYPVFLRYLEAARELGLRRKVQDRHPLPTGSVLAAVENGALSIDHYCRHDSFEMGLLARSSTLVTLLPATELFGDGPAAPARELAQGGVAVAIGSNFNPLESPILSMQTVIWLACRHLKLTPAEAISAATINGAHALGVAERVGSLECGKSADLLLLNTGDYRELGHRLGANAVHLTMKRGEIIYREGKVAPLAGKG